MSEKYSAELEGILEEIREDIGFYFERFEKTKSRADERRFYFSVVRYYKLQYEKEPSKNNEVLYERAKENWDRLFTEEDVFSPNRRD